MKIVVMWEDPDEEAAAVNLAEVLPRIAPSLGNAVIEANGSVSVSLNASQRRLRVRARACPAYDEAGYMESFREAAERAAKAIVAQRMEIKRSFGGEVVTIAGGRQRDWAPCANCGIPKYEGAQCANCQTPDQLEELRRIIYGWKADQTQQTPVKPQPPKETRELIFPEDDS